jgi:hypothetical protein
MNARPRIMMVGGSAFSSGVIERAGFGPWSHMAGLLADDTVLDARDDSVGGQPPGVHIRAAHYLHSQPRWAIFEAPTGDHYPAWEAALRSQLGKPYDTRGIADFAESVFTGTYVDPNYAGAASKAWFCDCLQLWGAVQSGDLRSPPDWFHFFAQTPSSAQEYFIGGGWVCVASKGMEKLAA